VCHPSASSTVHREILGYFLATYDVYEKLFEVLADKAFYMRADPLRHPLIFYYGHTAVLYVNKLRVANMVPLSSLLSKSAYTHSSNPCMRSC